MPKILLALPLGPKLAPLLRQGFTMVKRLKVRPCKSLLFVTVLVCDSETFFHFMADLLQSIVPCKQQNTGLSRGQPPSRH